MPSRTKAQILGIKNVKDLYSLDPVEIRRVKADPELLKAVTHKMAHAARKQIQRLEAAPMGSESPALVKLRSSGARLTVKGSTVEQMLDTFDALRDFHGKQTSTSTGWKRLQKATQKRVNKLVNKQAKSKKGRKPAQPKEWTPAQQKKFWKAYRQAAGTLNLQKYDSDQVQQVMRAVQAGGKNRIIGEINAFNGRLAGMTEQEINAATKAGLYVTFNTPDGEPELYKADLRSTDAFANLTVTWADMKLQSTGGISENTADVRRKYDSYKRR